LIFHLTGYIPYDFSNCGGKRGFKDCIDFANETKMCFLATVDGDHPRVRAVELWSADATGFYFYTGSIKPFYAQLRKNPRTELCFYKPGQGAGRMMRIEGMVEFLDDAGLKEKLIAQRPFLKDYGYTAGDPRLIMFRVAHGKAHFWTFETNLKPKEEIDF
jgi:uncharacterized pyridoxamine 5'-phosphate oxidase family protein